jgi:Fungal specific transcription factor domain
VQPTPIVHAGSPKSWVPTMIDLELMHQFTAFTASTISDNPLHNRLWTAIIPKMGFHHPFLLHGILSMAALHRRTQATEFEQSSLLDFARHHQQQALAEYIPVLGHITSDNCHPLFAFSQVIAGVSYALLQLSKGQNSARDFIQGIVAVFDLLIGATAIAYEGQEWLRQGELAAMMGHGPSLLDCNMVPISDEPKVAMASLIERIQGVSSAAQTPGTPEVVGPNEGYVSAIQKLALLFPRLPQTVPRVDTVVGWPVFLNPAYIAALKSEEPAALVVLAYYAVTLHKLKHMWWLEGIGARVVQAVSAIVGDEWGPYLIWPRTEVFKDEILTLL